MAVLATVAVVFLCLVYFTRMGAPFAFLRGREPVYWGPKERDRQSLVYSFEADDFKALRKQAETELLKEDFFIFSEEDSVVGTYFRAITDPPTRKGGSMPFWQPPENVHIHYNARWRGSIDSLRKGAPGWVTVVVDLKPRPTLMDGFRNWLGL